METKYILFILLSLVSEIVGTISGFGSSILFVPLASLFFEFKTVLCITAIFHVFSNISKLLLFNKGMQKQIAIKLGIPAVVFVSIGAYLTAYIPTNNVDMVIGVCMVALSIFMFINFDKELRQTNRNLYLSGVFSGFIAGIAGSGGAIRGLALAAFHLEKAAFIATSAIIDLGVDLSRAAIYIYNGYFNKAYIYLIPFLIGTSFIGSYLGKIILNHVSDKFFRYMVIIIVCITSLIQIIKYFTS